MCRVIYMRMQREEDIRKFREGSHHKEVTM
jgi:hypothetical protein